MYKVNVKGNKREYKAGNADIPIFQYSEDGKFLRKFANQMEVFKMFYDGKKGRLFDDNKQIRELPNQTIICKERLGRDSIILLKRIYTSKFCYKNINERPFSIYNLLGEKIYSFSSIDAYCKLTGEKISSIKLKLESHSLFAHDLRFQYDDIQKEISSIIDTSKVHNVHLIDKNKLKNYLLKSYLVNEGGRLIEMGIPEIELLKVV